MISLSCCDKDFTTETEKERKELRANGVNIRNKQAVKAYFEEKKRAAEEAVRHSGRR